MARMAARRTELVAVAGAVDLVRVRVRVEVRGRGRRRGRRRG